MQKKEKKITTTINMNPNIKATAKERAKKLNMSLGAYIEELIKEDLDNV